MDPTYSETTITQNKFIFVSYQHKDMDIVEADIEWYTSEGMRVWYDSALDYGDHWQKRVERIVRHENCCGVLFYSSKSAYTSEPIFFERNLAIEERAKRGEDKFFILPVNIGKPSTLELVREVFLYAPEDETALRKYINGRWLTQILELFPSEVLYIYADQEAREAYRTEVLEAVKKKCPDAVDSDDMKIRKLQRMMASAKGVPAMTLGRWLKGTASVPGVVPSERDQSVVYKGDKYIAFKGSTYSTEPINWLLISVSLEKVVFLADVLVDIRKADMNLSTWLADEFPALAFSEGERELLVDAPRLMREADMNIAENGTVLANPLRSVIEDSLYWWIEGKAFGNNQKVIKTKEGVLYNNGLTRNKAVGVRPVIEIDFEKLMKYLEGNK